jgi:hypothetical protein
MKTAYSLDQLIKITLQDKREIKGSLKFQVYKKRRWPFSNKKEGFVATSVGLRYFINDKVLTVDEVKQGDWYYREGHQFDVIDNRVYFIPVVILGFNNDFVFKKQFYDFKEAKKYAEGIVNKLKQNGKSVLITE